MTLQDLSNTILDRQICTVKTGLRSYLVKKEMMAINSEEYPGFIGQFNSIPLPDPEVKASLLDGQKGQVAFFDMPQGAEVPVHQHADSWAILVSGEMEVTVADKTFHARRGDSWFVPGHTLHGGVALKRTRLIEVFSEKRYHPEE